MHSLGFVPASFCLGCSSLLVMALLASAAGGQTPGTATGQQAAHSPGAAETQAPLVRTTTKLVLVDVVVSDHDKFVHGLDAKRFHLLENGHERTIVSCDEHQTPAEPASGAKLPLRHVVLPPHTYTNIPDYPRSPAMTVLLLDALNTPMSNQMDVRQRMIKYLEKLPPGDSIAIFTLSTRLRMVAGFSTDLGQLAQILKSPKAAGQTSLLLETQNLAQQTDTTSTAVMQSLPGQNGMKDAAIIAGAMPGAVSGPMDSIAALRQFQADLISAQYDQRVTITLEAFEELARYLSIIPGRKNIVWFSGSFPISVDPDSTLYDSFRAQRSYLDEVRETTQMLSDARIAVYPVDARGLMPPSMYNAGYTGPAYGGPDFGRQVMEEGANRAHEQDTMFRIADDTGGRAFVDTNDLTDALGDVVKNGGNFYTIGFQPPSSEMDGQFHAFKVKIDDAKYKLSYRSGYFADSPDKAAPHHPDQPDVIAASYLHGAPAETQITFDARILPSNDPVLQGAQLTPGPVGAMAGKLKGPVHRYVIDLAIDLHGFQFAVAPDGSHQTVAEFAVAAYDKDGNAVNTLEHSFQLSIRADRYEKLLASGIPARIELDLPEGPLSLRIAVNDLQSDRSGALEVPVLVRGQ